jgi:hypothetical protein
LIESIASEAFRTPVLLALSYLSCLTCSVLPILPALSYLICPACPTCSVLLPAPCSVLSCHIEACQSAKTAETTRGQHNTSLYAIQYPTGSVAILGKYQGTNFGPNHIALLSEVLGINGHLIDVHLVGVDLSGRNYYPDTPLRPPPRDTTLLSGMWWCVMVASNGSNYHV